jgi:hypothetical protein
METGTCGDPHFPQFLAMRSFPSMDIDWEGIPDLAPDPDSDNKEGEEEITINNADRVFFTQWKLEPMEIHTSSNFLQ